MMLGGWEVTGGVAEGNGSLPSDEYSLVFTRACTNK